MTLSRYPLLQRKKVLFYKILRKIFYEFNKNTVYKNIFLNKTIIYFSV